MERRLQLIRIGRTNSKILLVAGFGIMALFSQTVQSSSETLRSVLRNDSSFSLFTKAMDISDYWDRVTDRESATLFVPTDEAMVIEGSDFLLRSVLITPENRERLLDLVSMHITTDPVELEETLSSTVVQTLSGDCLMISRNGQAVKVGREAYLLTSSKIGNNQLIVIDRLLISDYRHDGEVRGC